MTQIDALILPDSKTNRAPHEVRSPRIECDSRGVWHIRGFAEAKSILNGETTQAGFNAELANKMPGNMIKPVLFQDGKPHLEQRRQTARFFTPTTVQDRYRPIMERYADKILADFRQAGRADLNQLAARMATSVVAEVVGLTASPLNALTARLDRLLHSNLNIGLRPNELLRYINVQWQLFMFYWKDVRPAIRERKTHMREDLISHLVSKTYKDAEIVTECLTYGAAGMVTTQEFICVAAWQLLERPELRQEFISGTTESRTRLLYEILRLEPVVGHLFRRAASDLVVETGDTQVTIPAGALIDLHIYAINADAEIVGEAPLQLQPDREIPRGVSGAVMGFGFGPHRCVGEHIAITESEIFLSRLLALDNLQIEKPPRLGANDTVKGYELRDFWIRLG